jgi:hypothetical protein
MKRAMTGEQRRKEICEIIELVNQVARLSHCELVKVLGIPVVMARLGDSSAQVEAIKGGGEGLAGDRQLVRHGANT